MNRRSQALLKIPILIMMKKYNKCIKKKKCKKKVVSANIKFAENTKAVDETMY